MSGQKKNISASIRGKLERKARELGRPFAELLQYYGMERFLYRLSKSKYSKAFILKGALMFNAWEVPSRRTTIDIDFLAKTQNQVKKIEGVVKEICNITGSKDGLIFEAESVVGQRIREDADYYGVRIKFRGFLERSRVPMQLDISFDDVISPRPKKIRYPSILGVSYLSLLGYPYESVISEKFEAMIKLGALNSRMKDFYDVWLLIRQFDFKGAAIQTSLQKTFLNRKTKLPSTPIIFPSEIFDEESDRNILWKAFLQKNQIQEAPQSLNRVAKDIQDFLLPPIQLLSVGKNFQKTWKASGPWQ